MVIPRYHRGVTLGIRAQRVLAYLAVGASLIIETAALIATVESGIGWHTAGILFAVPAWALTEGLAATVPAPCPGCQHPTHDGMCWCGHV
ncbi:Uncharacterised protein [Mycobacteroides abscessus subsp. abscessus]|uniref:hypothetical protein n=1 Tax=Mycobacteroides abscessus TaxID=36809 RepID=UPI0009CAC5C3|nr:hypothetical protein [Mycobacteroides abscessus]SKR27759.1 Uncharacterised protein [Mycobacteroides abscessus subsp. abscessus]